VVKGREWFQDRSCSMPQDDDALIAELTSPTVVQSKADMKKRGMRSPDLAFLLTFACGSGAQAVSSSRVLRPAAGHGWQRRIWGRVTPFSNCLLETGFCPKYAFGEPFPPWLSASSLVRLRILALGQSCSYLTEAPWPSQVGQRPKVNGAASEPLARSRTGEEDRAVSEQI
jgi:hypothetical protein